MLTFLGIDVDKEVYPWMVVVVLPINSALNPILYTLTSVLRNKNQKEAVQVMQLKTQLAMLKARVEYKGAISTSTDTDTVLDRISENDHPEVNSRNQSNNPEVNSSSQSNNPEVNSSSQSNNPEVNSISQSNNPEVNSISQSNHPEINSSSQDDHQEVNSSSQDDHQEVNSSSHPDVELSSLKYPPDVES
ncbi:type-2 histone deacetylase 2-like [Ostrea edulis]|uniref:type-2 histone deacetylase 2-like n=1 Tax=Ostrea edulis TaxID=37623 RepID=UPI0024AFB1CF|nr:type-2 histone deacetylase 2-like [Ostrea edulis]